MKTKLLFITCLLAVGLTRVPAQNSLWINDPTISWNWQTGRISEASLSVHPKGLYLEYGLYLTFSASNTYFDSNRQLEAVMDFTLPKGAMVLDSWLWVGDEIVQGKLIDRWSASDIYEGIVNRRRDPSVLYKNSDTQYQLRVYPMKKNVTRKVKITYLMPVTWLKDKVEASLPGGILMASSEIPNLNLLIWEEKGFDHPAFSNSEMLFEPKSDPEFGQYKKVTLTPEKVRSNLILRFDAPVQNGIYLSVFEDQNVNYYQMALSPGNFIAQNQHRKILVLFDYEAGNSNATRESLVAAMKQRILSGFGPDDSFNLLYSKLMIEQAYDTWKSVTPENLDAAFAPLISESMYSNLPGLFATAFDFLNETGGQGTIILFSNSDNFGNYEQANTLIKDLKAMQNPLPQIHIADLQDLMLNYYYIGNKFYYGQEYLYVNLSKASGGYFKSIRDESSIPALLTDVISSVQGMVTAFDLYTSPADGFCYGRFGSAGAEGFPVGQTITQIGKFYGQIPFMIYLTGLYQAEPFSQLIQVTEGEVHQADTMLTKMWHGRYIADLEKAERNNMIVQEILYESLNNRVLSVFSAFLCLEPSDSVSVCQTCKDESRLVGMENEIPLDSAGLVKLYPNPFREKLTIEISLESLTGVDEVMIRIFSLTGQLVFEQKEEGAGGRTVIAEWNGTAIHGDEVPAGQYIVMIRAGEMMISKQIMKSE